MVLGKIFLLVVYSTEGLSFPMALAGGYPQSLGMQDSLWGSYGVYHRE